MDADDFLRFAVLSGLIGFFAFCVSHACQVWRRRNAATRKQDSNRLVPLIRRLCGTLAVLGLLLVAATCLVREVWRPTGVLSGHDLFAVRGRDNLQLDFLCDGDRVEAGEVVARFRDPERQSEMSMLNMRLARLRTKQAELKLQPLELDKELTRRHHNISQHRRQLQAAYYQLLAEKNDIVRIELQNRLARADKVVQVQGESLRREVELTQAQTQLQYNRRELDRRLGLAARNALSQEQLDGSREAAELGAAEIARIERDLKSFERERSQLNASIATFEEVSREQASSLADEIRSINADIDALAEEESALAEQLMADKQRCLKQRDLQERQLGFQIAEAAAELEGLEESIVIKAPFDGQVVYRDTAPGSVFEQRSLLVLAPQQGGLFQTRMSPAQARALEKAGTVTLQVVDPLLQYRFAGEFRQMRSLPRETNTVIAQLHCSLPPETIKELAEGKLVEARLLWRPPLLTLVPLQVGLAIMGLGTGVWGLVLAFGADKAPQRQRKPTEGARAATTSRHAPRNGHAGSSNGNGHGFAYPIAHHGGSFGHNDVVRDGSAGPMLVLLGSRLREALREQDVDRDLLSAIEWALDRHHVRAIRLIRDGFGDDDEIETELEELLGGWEDALIADNGSASQAPDSNYRLRQILRTLCDQDPTHWNWTPVFGRGRSDCL